MNCALPACHSSFSLLSGTASPEKLVETANGHGYRELLLADVNNLYGTYDFYHAARAYGIRPIVGTELETGAGRLVLVAQNYDGYRNLCRLITHYQLKEKPGIEEIARHGDNLICISNLTIDTGDLSDIFGQRFYIGIERDNPSKKYHRAIKRGFKPAAVPRISFLNKEDYQTHRLLRAIGGGYLLKNLPDEEAAGPEDYLHDPKWYRGFYRPFPRAVANTFDLKEQIDLKFPDRKNILPDIEITGDHFERLRDDTITGLRKRVKTPSGAYLSRLDYELTVIRRTGFVDYFLIVGDIVEFCRRRGIAAVGRGSAAGSLVSYSLGITEVDPIREGLYFERFLNEARSDCPDIDLDIDWRMRDKVLDYIYDKYGHDRVAMMATYTRFQPRLAVRETARALGFSPKDIGRLVKDLPRMGMNGLIEPEKIKPGSHTQRHIREKCAPVLKLSRRLAGLPRHLGIHSGGIVITPKPLTDYVPLERATKGIVVTQCDMYQGEKIGLVKIDILGQRGLAVIADCRRAVKKIKGETSRIPDKDPGTYRFLRSGKTIGVFQIESPGLRALLRDLQPEELNDITLALALIRPGASESGMKRIFLDRFHGKEETVYPHPCLEQTLAETFGVFIYQEQVILAAQAIAGFNMAASDQLRRAITKKRKEIHRDALKGRFLDGASTKGVTWETAHDIYMQLRQFASFGFCKAHAATYGYLAYQSAYYKTHYPEIFMTAVLRNGGGYYPSAVYVAEARRMGVSVQAPDVNRSERNDVFKEDRIFLGLERIRDLTGKTIERIEESRPFCDLFDFVAKVEISEREMENLIKSGFFDSLEPSRTEAFWKYRLWGRNRTVERKDLFGGSAACPRMKGMPELEPFSRYDVFRAERDILGLTASFHPLTLFKTYHEAQEALLAKDGNGTAVSGWRADIKRIKTRKGEYMVFMTLDGLSDTFEVVLFPDVYNRYAEVIRRYRYLAIEGHISEDENTLSVIADRVYPAQTGLDEAKYI